MWSKETGGWKHQRYSFISHYVMIDYFVLKSISQRTFSLQKPYLSPLRLWKYRLHGLCSSLGFLHFLKLYGVYTGNAIVLLLNFLTPPPICHLLVLLCSKVCLESTYTLRQVLKKTPVRVLRASIVISFCKAVTKKRGNFFKK